jgi:hypothetical protein
MPLPPSPATLTTSPFSSMRGHHAAIRYPEFEAARSFWVDTMDWRVLQTWRVAGRPHSDGLCTFPPCALGRYH